MLHTRKSVNILPWRDRQWSQVNSTLEGRQKDLIWTYGLVKSEFSSAAVFVYLANHLTFPCLKFSTNRMGIGAFSCAPGTLGDGKHQGVKNHALLEWLLLLGAEDSNHMHRKHKLKPHPIALVLLLKIGTLASIMHLLTFVYLISNGTSGFGMSS